MSVAATSLPPRFWAKVRVSDCLIWAGAVNSKGYACFLVDGTAQLAHRLAYEDAYGPIPEDMTIDHRCRVRNCVNVDHLEVVTLAENNRRKKTMGGLRVGGECLYGHLITDESDIYRRKRGDTECRRCRSSKPHRAIPTP